MKHKLETIQYNACLALSGVTRRSFGEKCYLEIDLESFHMYTDLCCHHLVLCLN